MHTSSDGTAAHKRIAIVDMADPTNDVSKGSSPPPFLSPLPSTIRPPALSPPLPRLFPPFLPRIFLPSPPPSPSQKSLTAVQSRCFRTTAVMEALRSTAVQLKSAILLRGEEDTSILNAVLRGVPRDLGNKRGA